MTTLRNLIDGVSVDAASGATYDVVNPATGQVYATAPASGAEDVDRAMSAAERAFDGGWADTTPKERQEALLRMAQALEDRAEEFVQAECEDTGKPIGITRDEELPPSVDELRFFAGAARVLEGRSAGEYLKDHTSWVRREPIGVVAQVTPWNYPLMMAIWKIAPALAAGNTDRAEAERHHPRQHRAAGRARQRVPATGRSQRRSAATARPAARSSSTRSPQMVAITGSVRAGMEVAGSAAADLKRVHLELGGKAPVVVFDDADVGRGGRGDRRRRATSTPARTAPPPPASSSPRACTTTWWPRSPSRPATPAPACPTTPTCSTARSTTPTSWRGSAGWSTGCPTTRASTPAARGRRSPAARAATSSSPPSSPGCARTTRRSSRRSSVRSSRSSASATRPRRSASPTACSTASSSSVWTKDHARAMRMSRKLDFGVVWINTHIPFVSEMPHGGFKHSGYGKDLSMYSLEDYTRVKHVMSFTGEQ